MTGEPDGYVVEDDLFDRGGGYHTVVCAVCDFKTMFIDMSDWHRTTLNCGRCGKLMSRLAYVTGMSGNGFVKALIDRLGWSAGLCAAYRLYLDGDYDGMVARLKILLDDSLGAEGRLF